MDLSIPDKRWFTAQERARNERVRLEGIPDFPNKDKRVEELREVEEILEDTKDINALLTDRIKTPLQYLLSFSHLYLPQALQFPTSTNDICVSVCFPPLIVICVFAYSASATPSCVPQNADQVFCGGDCVGRESDDAYSFVIILFAHHSSAITWGRASRVCQKRDCRDQSSSLRLSGIF